MVADFTPPPPATKPGYKASELHMLAGTILAAILNKKLNLDVSPEVMAAAIAAATAYAGLRSWVKR
jgi:hypothetical protein